MYINAKLLKSRNLTLNEFAVLSLLRQNKFENNVDILETELTSDTLSKFENLGLIEQVKRKNKQQTEIELIRTTKKANEWLNDIGTAEVEPEDKTVFEWLKNHYIKAGKEVGNGAKTLRHIRDFRIKSGIEKNNLIKLVLDFLAENEERSKKLEYIWYYPKTAFATRFDLEESWLWNHFIKNKERLEKTFEEY